MNVNRNWARAAGTATAAFSDLNNNLCIECFKCAWLFEYALLQLVKGIYVIIVEETLFHKQFFSRSAGQVIAVSATATLDCKFSFCALNKETIVRIIAL